MGKELTGAEATRIATEVNHWVAQAQYKPTSEDTIIMKSVAASVIRVTLYKAALGAAGGALLGISLPRMIKSFKVPLSVMTSVGVLVGVVSDVANRQRESMSTWLKLQRNANTPLTEKIYRTTVEVAPLSNEGKIARAWLDQQVGQPVTELGVSDEINQPRPSIAPRTGPLISPSPQRPGSGYYDINHPVRRLGPRPSSDPHRPGTGFYDATQSSRVPPHSQLPSSHEYDYDETP